ncbi:MAG: prepilin-type N-terminal cleavage/methylation domain-containing protein [Planctomycetota bacterium]|nr:prepilin-type N-terminal cleavage/methylation domain-containing protein [Planctomycetaceae bacterium]MDQ3333077.1 prepilin-type N-terminal cleavage/methylation domain-containing protein [Planctomycetota bacterium]
MRRPSLNYTARKGFTLVEVLIVVVILGILAATVLPQFTSATEDAKESALKQNLQQIRSQIDLYRFQHNGLVPAKGSVVSEVFLKAMLCTTDAAGTSTGVLNPYDPGNGDFGPYLLGQFPPNPFNGKSSVSVTAGGSNPKSMTIGWWYDSTTGQIRPSLPDTMLARDGVTPLNMF